jgi:hypothetical protein
VVRAGLRGARVRNSVIRLAKICAFMSQALVFDYMIYMSKTIVVDIAVLGHM